MVKNPLEIVAGEDSTITANMTYAADYPVEEKRGTKILDADVERLYFAIKELSTSATPFLELNDESDAEIEWLEDGKAIIYIAGEDTLTKAGLNRYWELRAKMTDGAYQTIDRGYIHIHPTAVGRPA